MLLVTAAGAGVLVGAAVARRLGWLRRRRRWLVARRAVAATYGLLVLALLVLVALPPTTEPIRDPSGQPVQGSIA